MRMGATLHPRRRTAGALARHRAFLARLRRAGHDDPHARPLARILRGAFVCASSIGVTLSFPRSFVHVHAASPVALAGAAKRSAHSRPAADVARLYWHPSWRELRVRTLVNVPAVARREAPRQLHPVRVSRVVAVDRWNPRAAVPPLALTLLRTLPAPVVAANEQARVWPASAPRAARSLELAGGADFGQLPQDELSRVTEHVLRTLDRRVLSHRERTGQV